MMALPMVILVSLLMLLRLSASGVGVLSANVVLHVIALVKALYVVRPA